MNDDQSGLRLRETAPDEPSPLSLWIGRVLNEHTVQPLQAIFRYDPDTPVIVTTTLVPHVGAAVTWRISRELLYRGLLEGSGEWDVRVWPAKEEPSVAWMLLDSRHGSALFELPVPVLVEWLEATYRFVPAEAEDDVLDWDGFLAEVLEAPAPPPAE